MHNKKILFLLFLLTFIPVILIAEPVSILGMVKVKATVQEAPPAWAVMQRHLIKTINEAVSIYLDKYTYRDRTARWSRKNWGGI